MMLKMVANMRIHYL